MGLVWPKQILKDPRKWNRKMLYQMKRRWNLNKQGLPQRTKTRKEEQTKSQNIKKTHRRIERRMLMKIRMMRNTCIKSQPQTNQWLHLHQVFFTRCVYWPVVITVAYTRRKSWNNLHFFWFEKPFKVPKFTASLLKKKQPSTCQRSNFFFRFVHKHIYWKNRI